MAQRASLASAASPYTAASDTKTSVQQDNDNDNDNDNANDPHVPDSLPPWVHLTSNNAEHAIPEPIIPNTRHFKPPPAHNHKPGKKWDHLRSAEAVLISTPIAEFQQQWKPFMRSGPSTRYDADNEGARLMSAAWYEENMPISRRGWEKSDEALDKSENEEGTWLLFFLSTERRERAVRVFWRLMLKNPFVPLIFRIILLAFAAAALGIAATIYRTVSNANSDGNQGNNCATRASTDMALIVGSIGVPYIVYVTWDEYTAKPLGLRSAFAKTSLLLVDLYFIIFSASNLSLAFDALFDHRWACYDDVYQSVAGAIVPGSCPQNPGICYKQKALSAVLFLSLVTWLITFSISVMRVVEKLRV